MEKRLISIGFKEPKNLEGNVIYVTLTDALNPCAKATSKEEFNYTGRAIAGNILSETTKEISGREGMRGHARNYWEVINELVEKNNGRLDWSKAIKEGCKAYDTMRDLLR